MSAVLAMQTVERRHAPRFEIEARITMESQTNFFAGFSENICEGGVFVAMQAPPRVGEIVRLRVHLGDGRDVLAAGEVAWHRLNERGEGVGCGVKFIGLDGESAEALQAMMACSGQPPLLVE